MQKLSLVLILLALTHPALADDPTPTTSTTLKDVAKLIERIEELKNRVKELERNSVRPSTLTVVPQYQPYAPPQQTQPTIPNTISPPTYYVPAPFGAVPYPQPLNPAAPYQPPIQKGKKVPESWKPFNFNGAEYYIIPIEEAARLNR